MDREQSQLGELGRLLSSRLSERARRPRLQVISLRVPVLPVEHFFDADAGKADAWYYASGRDGECAGLDVVERIVASGEDRFVAVDESIRNLWDQIEPGADDPEAPPPRLVGGLAFQADRTAQAPWLTFGAAQFVLPRIGYVREGDRAWLSLAFRGSEVATAEQRQRMVGSVLSVLTCERQREQLGHPAARSSRRDVREDSALEWRAAVQDIRRSIGRGDVQKIVLARRMLVRLGREVSPGQVLLQLRAADASGARFAFRLGGATFLGAPPERLLVKRGLSIETEAVAGSVLASAPGAIHELLGSTKLRAEQSPVVTELAARLAEYVKLDPIPELPVSHVVRNVVHLRTPISGTLRAPVRAMRLLEAIHPTPAVGGAPTRLALEWIRQNEPHERGWYAAPVGWVDAQDDAEFSVGIRSGVLVGEAAYLYAGAGIVQDSDPDAEFEETRWKLNVLLKALDQS